jgi:hypothetical protein
VGENYLLIREVERDIQRNNGAVQQWCSEQHLGMHNLLILVMDGWAIAAEDHTRFHFYLL